VILFAHAMLVHTVFAHTMRRAATELEADLFRVTALAA
jgi:hypothetical protein